MSDTAIWVKALRGTVLTIGGVLLAATILVTASIIMGSLLGYIDAKKKECPTFNAMCIEGHEYLHVEGQLLLRLDEHDKPVHCTYGTGNTPLHQ